MNKKSLIKNFKDHKTYKSFWVVKEKVAYFIILSKYGVTVGDKITLEKEEPHERDIN